ncbi:MAG TPA: hypothetical protein VLL54_05405 [Pyrinomonadaceae bacterium]|nr:hypothetical protein [Pyrinomonadaceae bacterium]
MRKSRVILLAALLLAILGVIWLYLGKPAQVDMAIYAPADSLLYLEANKPVDVAEAIASTEAWRTIGGAVGPLAQAPQNGLLRELISRTGIGPVQSVVLARAQVAVVLTDLRTVEEGDTLNIRPEAVLLIETHTRSSRVRPVFESYLKTLAEKTYVHPTFRRSNIDGVEFLEWLAPENSRQIVATINDSLIMIGTSEQAVRKCLATARGSNPNLKGDAEFLRIRTELQGSSTLTFGFVPQNSSPKLLAVGLPALAGRAPGDAQFQRLIATGAGKIFGSLAWCSRVFKTGIEDRYLIAFQTPVGTRLKGPFQFSGRAYDPDQGLPSKVYSVTSYNFANPLDAWQTLNSTVSSQVDAFSTIVFSSLLKSSLISYGIEDPPAFLAATKGPLLTLKLDDADERSLLIAGVQNRDALKSLVEKHLSPWPEESRNGVEMFEDSSGELGAELRDELVIFGPPEDIRRYDELSGKLKNDELQRLSFFRSTQSEASVVTYSNDADRVRTFIAAILVAKGLSTELSEPNLNAIASLPYSITETTLTDQGIERVTRSPLGQFSSLFPLLLPTQPANSNGAPSK